ncbi:LOB domain-containing protein 1-like [Argentina anserina]|uniref:LOB domain-containing protein 1-like n=1 Tax=Argentina anserina TaxID=57926 RepID=UPI0021766756|nr:LOB domain-containing protein 1-like [Potentilla anserina]
MEFNGNTTATTTTPPLSFTYSPLISTSSSPQISSSPATSPTTSSHPAPPPAIVVSPCAACKILRRRCVERCVLAPYFPPSDPIKFTTAHRVFGASNIIKFLQDLPESQRADAVSSMVYEANARLRDPVYGCAGAICNLQKQVTELQSQLAKAQAEITNMQCHQGNLIALICMDMSSTTATNTQQSKEAVLVPILQQQPYSNIHIDTNCFLDENNLDTACDWEPLWT